MATKRQIRKEMINLARDRNPNVMEGREINATKLAEIAAHNLNIHDVLDDPNHFIWDLALDVAEIAENIIEEDC